MTAWVADEKLDAWVATRREAIESAERTDATTMRCAFHMGAFDEPMWLVPESEWKADAPRGTLRMWVCTADGCRTVVAEVRG